jgi:hypothetical protein
MRSGYTDTAEHPVRLQASNDNAEIRMKLVARADECVAVAVRAAFQPSFESPRQFSTPARQLRECQQLVDWNTIRRVRHQAARVVAAGISAPSRSSATSSVPLQNPGTRLAAGPFKPLTDGASTLARSDSSCSAVGMKEGEERYGSDQIAVRRVVVSVFAARGRGQPESRCVAAAELTVRCSIAAHPC